MFLYSERENDFLIVGNCNGRNATLVRAHSCYLSMKTFWKGPFYRKTGALIKVKVRGVNLKGNGTFSPANSEGALVESAPSAPTSLNGQIHHESNRIRVRWSNVTETGGSEVLGYALESWTGTGEEGWKELIGERDYLKVGWIDERSSTEKV